jgi:hypothetical protein
MERREMRTTRERRRPLGVDRKIILKWIFKK